MATRPFFTGDYGAHLARVDTRPIIEAGKAQGQIFAKMGKDIGGMIKEYGLNEQKRAKLTNDIENTLELNPQYAARLTQSGDEATDKKNYVMLEKLSKGDLKTSEIEGLSGKLAMMEKQDLKASAAANQELVNALKRSQLLTEEQARDINNENRNLKKIERARDEKFYGSVEGKLNDLTVAVGSGMKKFDELGHFEKFVLGNAAAIRNRAIPKEDLFYDPSADLDEAKAKLEYESLMGQEQDRQLDRQERDAPPMFSTQEALDEYSSSLPPGVSASAVRHKGGWNINEVKISPKARPQDFQPIKGYDNYYVLGAYVYEGDPSTGKLSKLSASQIGEDTNRLVKVLGAMRTPDVESYMRAKVEGVLEDGVYKIEIETPDEEYKYEIPYSDLMENKVREIEKLENMMIESVPDLVDMRTRR
tara:strand:+ start:2494 stop:3750 length:1257 start_codon:yes stop_codon:yes gene_type:complete